MLIVISPAKSLDFESPLQSEDYTLPHFIHESEKLISDCRKLTVDDIEKLMSISPTLAELNYSRFQEWRPDFNLSNARQAIFAFKGDLYKGLEIEDFNHDDLKFTQSHLRILSGLYGLLRPLDLIKPYRLEMGIRLKNGNNRNLYQFWNSRITDELNDQFNKMGEDRTLINLASNEYFKAIMPKKLNATIINPIFLDKKGEDYKIISFYAKHARGLMSRFILKNRIVEVNDIKHFDLDGYQFSPSRSTDQEWYFIRDER